MPLGITFQQVQKYEKGTNRIGASRLQHIAQILQVPIALLFEGIPGQPPAHRDVTSLSYVSDFFASPDGLALAKAFSRLKNPKIRRNIVHLVQEIAGD